MLKMERQSKLENVYRYYTFAMGFVVDPWMSQWLKTDTQEPKHVYANVPDGRLPSLISVLEENDSDVEQFSVRKPTAYSTGADTNPGTETNRNTDTNTKTYIGTDTGACPGCVL